jgi:crossover junction endodeoxyribonuclease RuvC
MRIIGIDPGSVITGLGVIGENNGSPFLLGYDALKMKSSMPIPERLKMIYDFVTRKIKLLKPDTLAIETAFYGKNIQSTLKLGQVRGAIMIAAMNMNIPVDEYSPREIKKSVTGNGAASKTDVQVYIKNILRMKDDRILSDSSDALAIALCHLYNSQNLVKAKMGRTKKSTWKEFIERNPGKIYRRIK